MPEIQPQNEHEDNSCSRPLSQGETADSSEETSEDQAAIRIPAHLLEPPEEWTNE